MSNEPFNDLKQFSAYDAKILASLKEIGQVEGVTVHHVDFETGDLIISIDASEKSFDGVMTSIMFCAINEQMKVKSANFDTGEIKIRWLPDMPFGLDHEEVSHIRNNRKIHAIKAVRKRTGMGLADAKRYIEKHWDAVRDE